MGLFGLFWDMRQERRIDDAEARAERHADRLRSAASDMQRMQADIDRVMLFNQAFWELLRDRAGLTEEELEAKVREVDLRDGRADGRAVAEAIPCPRCRRPNNAARAECIYCEATLRADR